MAVVIMAVLVIQYAVPLIRERKALKKDSPFGG